jgi:hypothetical protein
VDRTARVAAAVALAVAALSAAGCSKPGGGGAPGGGLGKLVHAGPVRVLSPAPDGSALAFLDGCADVKATFLPPGTGRCDLRVVPTVGGGAAKVASGVMTLPGGLSWRPDGKALAAMADHDLANGAATLVLWRDGATRPLADGVTFQGFAGNGELGFVAKGTLSILLPQESAPRALPGGDRVASFDVTSFEYAECNAKVRAGVRLVARRTQAAGGELLAADCSLARLEPLDRGPVGDYGFSKLGLNLAWLSGGKDGQTLRTLQIVQAAPRDVAKGVQSFAFGAAGSYLAWIADAVPGRQGNLHYGRHAVGGWEDVVLAKEVGEFRWAEKTPRLAWLEGYDPRVRAGRLGVGGEHLPTRTLAQNVSDVEISALGMQVAFLQHTTRGGYSVDLGLAQIDPAGASTATTVARGVFGFAFSPDAKWLYYRTRCTRNAEACDLERVPAGGLAPGAKPEAIAPGVKSFEFDPRDPSRLLVGWQRQDLVALDIGVWEQGKLTRVDQGVLPGSARFLGPDSRRLAYVVIQPKRQGVYVAELPR